MSVLSHYALVGHNLQLASSKKLYFGLEVYQTLRVLLRAHHIWHTCKSRHPSMVRAIPFSRYQHALSRLCTDPSSWHKPLIRQQKLSSPAGCQCKGMLPLFVRGALQEPKKPLKHRNSLMDLGFKSGYAGARRNAVAICPTAAWEPHKRLKSSWAVVCGRPCQGCAFLNQSMAFTEALSKTFILITITGLANTITLIL
eukprot:c22758_g11_i1 orf=2-592(-)